MNNHSFREKTRSMTYNRWLLRFTFLVIMGCLATLWFGFRGHHDTNGIFTSESHQISRHLLVWSDSSDNVIKSVPKTNHIKVQSNDVARNGSITPDTSSMNLTIDRPDENDAYYYYNCSPQAVSNFPRDIFTNQQRRYGLFLLHILLALYMFVGLALVCDDYFVPSLEGICNALHLQPDVAGATFMAAGSSAPELATTVIGVFIAKDDIGLGAVVGSADYNIMFVISMCALCAKTVVDLNWWPLVRDSLVYCLSIILLAAIIRDERVYWYEAALLLLVYGFYVLLMVFNQRLERFFLNAFPSMGHHAKAAPIGVCFPHVGAPPSGHHHHIYLVEEGGHSSPTHDKDHHTHGEGTVLAQFRDATGLSPYRTLEEVEVHQRSTEHGLGIGFENAGIHLGEDWMSGPAAVSTSADSSATTGTPPAVLDLGALGSRQQSPEEMQDEGGEEEGPESCFSVLERPRRMNEDEFTRESLFASCCSAKQWHVVATLLHVLAFPLKVLLCFTVPDCRLVRWRRFFWITFTTSCVWIAVYSYIMIWMITVVGHTLGIPDSVMGLTLIAAGSSVPDAIASVLVVREGQGDMAVSNAVGSNVFDILVCMAVPWLLKTLSINGPVYIYSRGLLYATFTLLSTVVILLVSMHINKWRLTKRYGVVLLVVYFAYLVLCTLYELNVFGRVHPPECPFVD